MVFKPVRVSNNYGLIQTLVGGVAMDAALDKRVAIRWPDGCEGVWEVRYKHYTESVWEQGQASASQVTSLIPQVKVLYGGTSVWVDLASLPRIKVALLRK